MYNGNVYNILVKNMEPRIELNNTNLYFAKTTTDIETVQNQTLDRRNGTRTY